MRSILIAGFLILSAATGFSQDYMAKITAKTCECLDKIPDTSEGQEFNMKLGVCMIEASMPYKAEILKDLAIDMDNIGGADGEKLGRLIGVKMAAVCPNSLVKVSQRQGGSGTTKTKEQNATGTITKVESDFFVTFSLKDDAGKIIKFYWLTFIESDVDMLKYGSLNGRKVSIDYEPNDFFDPKIGEYRQYFIVKKLALL